MHNWPLLPGCLLEEVENTCVDLRLWRLGIRQRPWLLSLEDRWWCGSPSDLVWLCGWDEGQESWKTTASVFRPTSCEQHTVVGAACCHGNALRITEASFSILNIWIWTMIMFREALIMNITVSHMMFLNIFDSSEIFMCKRWKLTFQFHPHPAVMEVLEQLTQPNSCFHEWLVCTNTMRTTWTQPCVSAWEWLSRRTLGGGEPPKQQPKKSNPCYFNSTFLSGVSTAAQTLMSISSSIRRLMTSSVTAATRPTSGSMTSSGKLSPSGCWLE